MSIRRTKLRKLFVSLFALMFIVPFFSSVATAQTTKVAASPQQHHIELEELKAEMRALQNRIDSMEPESGEAKSDSWYNDIKITTKKGTGLTFSTIDENYKLRMRLRGQFQASISESDGPGDATTLNGEGLGLEIRRARLAFDGNVFRKWLKYKVQLDLLNDEGILQDIRFDFAYNTLFVPRIGQYKVPFNREELTSSSALQFVDRSEMNSQFDWDRDIGIGAWGIIGDYIRYEGGIFQGEGINASDDSSDFAVIYAGRIDVSPFGGDHKKIATNFGKGTSLVFGFAVAGIDLDEGLVDDPDGDAGEGIDRIEDAGADAGSVVSITADMNFKWNDRANLELEYIGRFVDPSGVAVDTIYDQGFRVQGGFFLIPKVLEVAGRFAYVDFDTDEVGGTPDEFYEITPAINWYLSKDHRWKLQLDYTYLRDNDFDQTGDDINANLLRAQLQAYF